MDKKKEIKINVVVTPDIKDQINIITSVLGVTQKEYLTNLVLNDLEKNKQVIDAVIKARENNSR